MQGFGAQTSDVLQRPKNTARAGPWHLLRGQGTDNSPLTTHFAASSLAAAGFSVSALGFSVSCGLNTRSS